MRRKRNRGIQTPSRTSNPAAANLSLSSANLNVTLPTRQPVPQDLPIGPQFSGVNRQYSNDSDDEKEDDLPPPSFARTNTGEEREKKMMKKMMKKMKKMKKIFISSSSTSITITQL